jgi:hypothetical protein
MKTKLYAILTATSCLLIGITNANAREKTFGYRWNMHTTETFANAVIDSTENDTSVIFGVRFEEKGKIGTLVPVYQLDKHGAEVTASIRYKTLNCERAYITLNSIGAGEQILKSDTIELPLTEEWKEVSKKIKIKDAYLLNVFIEAIGSELAFNNIRVSAFKLEANGAQLKNETAPKSDNTTLKKSDAITLNGVDFGKIPSMQSRIMGIGETIHGSKTLGRMAFDIIKERIIKQGCNLVLHEYPLEYSFYINRYVKNDPRFKLQDIERYMEGNLSSEHTIDFIKWLRAYNSAHNNRVSFWGIDIESLDIASSVDLSEFVKTLCSKRETPETDSIVKRLLNWETNEDDSLQLTKADGAVGKWLTADERQILKLCLQLNKESSETYERLTNRDETMAKTAFALIDILASNGAKATIYGHFMHLNYLVGGDMKELNNYSVGHRMRAKYKDDYQAIALCTYEGRTLNCLTDKSIGAAQLVKAPEGSIENTLQSMGHNMAYLPTERLNNTDVLTMRVLGNTNDNNQFFYFVPKARVDGILFVSRSQPVEKSQEVLNRYLNYVDATVRRYLENAKEKMRKLRENGLNE